MFVFLWIMRQEREFLAHRAHIQAKIAPDNQKAVQGAFTDLTHAYDPYLEGHKKDEEKKAKERMLKEVNRGALAVTPTGPWIGGRSKGLLRKKLMEQFKGNEEESKPRTKIDDQFARRRHR